MNRKYRSFHDYVISKFRKEPEHIHYYVEESYHDEPRYYRHQINMILEALHPNKQKEYMAIIDFILTARHDIAVKYTMNEYRDIFMMDYLIRMTKAYRNRCKFRHKRNFCYYTYSDKKFYGEYIYNGHLIMIESVSINKLKKELGIVFEQVVMRSNIYNDLKNGLEEIIKDKGIQ